MVVLNGDKRTVHYFAQGGSPSEQATLDSLARAENKLAMEDELQALKRQYIINEQFMEARRHQQQMALYGVSFETNTSRKHEVSGNWLGQTSPIGTPINTPWFVGSGFFGFANAVGLNGSAGSGVYGNDIYTIKTDAKYTQSLANGMGDEGAFKRDMVAAITKGGPSESDAPEQLKQARANFRFNAEGVPIGYVGPQPERKEPKKEEMKEPRRAKITLRNGKVESGDVVYQDDRWVKLRRPDRSEIELPRDKIDLIEWQLPK
jgi:hypothetical protein